MKDEFIYLVVETTKHEDFGEFDTVPYWFETEQEANEIVEMTHDDSRRVEKYNKKEWLDFQYGEQ